MKIKIKENNPFKLDYFKVQKLIKELFEQDTKKIDQDSKKDRNKDSDKPQFPMDYIIFKFPNVKNVLTELLTVTFRDYIDNIYVMAPKPTTFKVVLKNKQDFLIIYDERSYTIKASGKKYYLANLSERERAIKAIADLLNSKRFITSKTEDDEKQSDGPDKEKGAKLGRPKGSGGGSSGGSSEPTLSDLKDKEEEGGEELPELPADILGDEGGTGEETPEEEPLTENSKIRIKKESIFNLFESFSNNLELEQFQQQLSEDQAVEEITAEEAADLIRNAGASMFTVEFKKKDGSHRILNGRRGVKKHLKGGSLPYSAEEKGLISVYDMHASQGQGYRMLHKDSIVAIRINGKNYRVVQKKTELEEIQIYSHNNLNPQDIFDKFIENVHQKHSINNANESQLIIFQEIIKFLKSKINRDLTLTNLGGWLKIISTPQDRAQFNKLIDKYIKAKSVNEIQIKQPFTLVKGGIYRFNDWGDDEWRNNYKYLGLNHAKTMYVFLDLEKIPGTSEESRKTYIPVDDLPEYIKFKKIEKQDSVWPNAMGDREVNEIQIKPSLPSREEVYDLLVDVWDNAKISRIKLYKFLRDSGWQGGTMRMVKRFIYDKISDVNLIKLYNYLKPYQNISEIQINKPFLQINKWYKIIPYYNPRKFIGIKNNLYIFKSLEDSELIFSKEEIENLIKNKHINLAEKKDGDYRHQDIFEDDISLKVNEIQIKSSYFTPGKSYTKIRKDSYTDETQRNQLHKSKRYPLTFIKKDSDGYYVFKLPRHNNPLFFNKREIKQYDWKEFNDIQENNEKISKNLARKKHFINQAIQDKIKKLETDPEFISKQQQLQNPAGKQAVQNIEYYQQLLQQSRLNPKTRALLQGIINNIKQNRGFASSNQLSILSKFKLGGLQEIQINKLKNIQNIDEIQIRHNSKTPQDVLDIIDLALDKNVQNWNEIAAEVRKYCESGNYTACIEKLDRKTSSELYYNLYKLYSKNNINESRISDLKSKLVGKSIDENEFDQISNISVPKPIYTEWLINSYIKEFKSQNKSIDDFLKLEPNKLIEFFEKNKNLFDNKDITSYSIISLNKKVMDITSEVGPASALSTLDLNKLAKAGFKNLGEIDGYQVIKIPKGKNSPEAWQTYKNIICQGRTRVCTASNYTRFEYYTTNDNLYLLINPEDEKAPYHYSKFTDSRVDKDDQKIEDSKILGIIDKLK